MNHSGDSKQQDDDEGEGSNHPGGKNMSYVALVSAYRDEPHQRKEFCLSVGTQIICRFQNSMLMAKGLDPFPRLVVRKIQ